MGNRVESKKGLQGNRNVGLGKKLGNEGKAERGGCHSEKKGPDHHEKN